MKKSIVVFMVVFAVLAVAQPQQQPAAGASGQPAAQQKTIKDPAEYNAYVNAMKTTDPNQKAIELEGFLQQYPNSVMKEDALELLMGAYQQTNNMAKVIDTAKRVLQANPNNLKALALLTYIDRAQATQTQNQQQLAEAAQYGKQGLQALQTAPKPEGLADADWQKFKEQVKPIFAGAVGQNAYATKDFAAAQTNLQMAVDANPNDMSNVYPLAASYLEATPPNVLGFWYIARAAALAAQAPAQQQQIVKYGKARYSRYHGDVDGWDALLQQAAAQPAPPQGWTIKPAPTPAEQAGILVQSTPVNKMSFDQIQLILTSGNQEAADKVWADLKDKPTGFVAKVINATPTKLSLAATFEGGEKNIPDVEITMAAPIPARLVPKTGADVTVKATPVSYTPNPFVITMKEGFLAGKEPAPAATKPTAKPAAKPGARKAPAKKQ